MAGRHAAERRPHGQAINDISRLSKADPAIDTPTQQRVEASAVAGEVARQLAEMASDRPDVREETG